MADKKMSKETSGHNVQKQEAEESKSEFSKDTGAFSEQAESGRKVRKSSDSYHRRDTHHQSQKKGTYHRKREQKERQKHQQHQQYQQQHSTKATDGSDTKHKDTKNNDNTHNASNTFTESEGTFSGKVEKAQKKAEKAGQKVEKARGKMPKKKEYTLQRVFDEKSGKGKYVVVPVEREKPFKEAGVPKSAMRRLQNESRNFVHGKVAETEKENSAVEGFHKTEQRAEDAFGFVKSQYQGKAQRQREKIAKLEKKQFKAEVNFQYQKFLEENPQVQKKAVQKRLQKQRIKREYIKARKNGAATKAAKEAVSSTANVTSAVAKKLQELARKNASLLVTVGVMAILLIMIMTSISSCGAMFSNVSSTTLAASYLSNPAEIDATDFAFTRLELDLQKEIDGIETAYPGYDEYSYNLGAIGHNPFTLIGYLSAVHTEFTASEVEREVAALFNEMYTLTITPTTEIRIRTVTRTGTRTVTDPITLEETEETYEYEEEEEYEVSVLKVVLVTKPLETIIAAKMDTEQTEIYGMYAETKGLLQEFVSPVDLYWYNYISSYYGYRKNSSTGNEEFHRGVDIVVPTGTTVYATHDGTVTTAAYDSYFGNYIVIEKDGYTTKYAHLSSLNVSAGQSVTTGTVIGTTGNTGSSMGSHLHIECLYQGEYYNPLFYFGAGTGTLYGEGTGGVPGGVIPPDAYDDATVQALMEEAAKYLGYPYVWGGSSPSTSFDCSGFVCWVFTNSGAHNLPRTTAQGIYQQCTPMTSS